MLNVKQLIIKTLIQLMHMLIQAFHNVYFKVHNQLIILIQIKQVFNFKQDQLHLLHLIHMVFIIIMIGQDKMDLLVLLVVYLQ